MPWGDRQGANETAEVIVLLPERCDTVQRLMPVLRLSREEVKPL